MSEVEKHNSADSLWVVIGQDVWDMTEVRSLYSSLVQTTTTLIALLLCPPSTIP